MPSSPASPSRRCSRRPSGSSRSAVISHGPWAAGRSGKRRVGGSAVAGRPVPAAAHRRRGARPHLHQARPDHLQRRGPVPRGAGRRDEEVPRPGPGRDVGRRADGSSRRTSAARSPRSSRRSSTTPLAAASIAQVHRATLRTGEEVVVKVQRPTVATRVRQDLRVMAWIAPKMVGRIPVAALANPPALVELFAETIAEELDFRLEAENMLDVAPSFAAARPARLRHPPSAPHARHPPRPGDGAARRLQVRRRRRHEGRGRRHREGRAHRDDRLHGRGADPRHLPRRPPRRQPLHPARRPHRAARLRHHRPARRVQAPRVPPPAHVGHVQRSQGPARRVPRPRGAARRTPTSTR